MSEQRIIATEQDKVKYFTPKEVAEICQVGFRTVYRWISTGKLPISSFGPHYPKMIADTDIPTFFRNRNARSK